MIEFEVAASWSLTWPMTEDPEFPFALQVDDQSWRVRINDFPAEPMYTLIVDGTEIQDFDDWPEAWGR